uniref:Uncharacterized protein n=1 Tax=Arundo donax TaxID=35708 RepID=A0A0A9AJY2_ARUDO
MVSDQVHIGEEWAITSQRQVNGDSQYKSEYFSFNPSEASIIHQSNWPNNYVLSG